MLDKCKEDGGTCGLGGYCKTCPYNLERQEKDVDDCLIEPPFCAHCGGTCECEDFDFETDHDVGN